jgi:hypothetical protein
MLIVDPNALVILFNKGTKTIERSSYKGNKSLVMSSSDFDVEMQDAPSCCETPSSTERQVNTYLQQMNNPHQILGVSPDASLDDIKLAYRRLALRCHPDKVEGDDCSKARAHDEFSKVSAAYEQILSTNYSTSSATRNAPAAVLYGPVLTDPYELFRHTFSSQPPPPYHAPAGLLFNSWTDEHDGSRGISSPNGKIAGYLMNEPANQELDMTTTQTLDGEIACKRVPTTRGNIALNVQDEPTPKRQRLFLRQPQQQAPLQPYQPNFNAQWLQPTLPSLKRDTGEMPEDPEFLCLPPALKRARVVCA